ncbi:MAG TPA: hypothetical protein VF134_01475 [Candidatus Dormibacteraeota bacterium]
MRYETILSRALGITWRHKYLWLLALLAGEGAATLPTGSGGGGGSSSRQYGGGLPAGMSPGEAGAWIGSHSALLWTLGLALGAAALVLLIVSAIANGALIKASAEHDLEHEFSLGSAWRSGLRTFWSVLGVKVVALIVSIAAVLVIGSTVLATVFGVLAKQPALALSAGLLAAVLIVIAIPFSLVFGVAILFAQRAIVLEGRAPLAAFGAGLALIRRRMGRVAVVWLLVAILKVVLGIAAQLALVVFAVPLAGVVAAAYFTSGIGAALTVGVPAALVWLGGALVAWGALSAYLSTIWTLAYTRFDQEPAPAAVTGPVPAV